MKVTSSKALNEDKQTPGTEVKIQLKSLESTDNCGCFYCSALLYHASKLIRQHMYVMLSDIISDLPRIICRTSHSLKSLTRFPHNVYRVMLQTTRFKQWAVCYISEMSNRTTRFDDSVCYIYVWSVNVLCALEWMGILKIVIDVNNVLLPSLQIYLLLHIPKCLHISS